MKNKKLGMLLLAIVLCISCFLTCFATTIQVAYASSIGVVGGYTNVLEDLQKDDTFNAEDYPIIQDDYSLQVITIAESTDKELFVYVYQPSANYGNLRATTINLSKNLHNKLTFTNYKLALINSKGPFYKYVIMGISVESSSTRYYDISSIFRAWNSAYDEDTGNDNTISEVSFKVAKQFTLVGNGEDIVTSVADTEVITITDKYVGFVRYDGATNFWGNSWNCDSHFVAFSTDREINELLEADIYFNYSPYEYADYMSELSVEKSNGSSETYYSCKKVSDIGSYIISRDCSPYSGYAYLTGEQSGSYESGKWSYDWARIQSVSEFIDSEHRSNIYDNGFVSVNQSSELTDEAMANLECKDWVLRFFESEYKYETGFNGGLYYGTVVYNVSILRLKFQTGGITYNLGVVDNMQSSNGIPDNYTEYSIGLSEVFKYLMGILLLILLVIVLYPVLPIVFSFIGKIIKVIFKAIIWLVTAPFKLIGKVFKKRE